MPWLNNTATRDAEKEPLVPTEKERQFPQVAPDDPRHAEAGKSAPIALRRAIPKHQLALYSVQRER